MTIALSIFLKELKVSAGTPKTADNTRGGSQDALIRAVTEGPKPSRTFNLGMEARSIIESIAERHPEANPDLIADAYDAFDREAHGEEWRVSGVAPKC